MSAVTSSRLTVTVSILLVMLSLSANEQRFYLYARYSICLEMSWITVIYEKYIELNSTAQVKITFRIVQARGTHTPTHACPQPYHMGSGSHGQLFGIYWGSPAWHSCQVNEQEKPMSQRPSTAARRVQSTPLNASSTTHVGAVGWEPLGSSPMTCVGQMDHGLAYVCPLL